MDLLKSEEAKNAIYREHKLTLTILFLWHQHKNRSFVEVSFLSTYPRPWSRRSFIWVAATDTATDFRPRTRQSRQGTLYQHNIVKGAYFRCLNKHPKLLKDVALVTLGIQSTPLNLFHEFFSNMIPTRAVNQCKVSIELVPYVQKMNRNIRLRFRAF